MKFLLFGGVGLIEMFFVTQRIRLIAKGRSVEAATLVFFEDFIHFFLIYQIARNLYDDWPLFIVYALGNSLGTYLTLQRRRDD